MNHPTLTAIGVLTMTALGMLTACGGSGGDAGDSATAVDAAAVERIADGLAEGEYELTFTGIASDREGYSGDADPTVYEVGSGGTNAEGPYRVRLRTDGHHDEADADMPATFTLVMPGDVALGTHELVSTMDREDDEVGVRFDGAAREWMFTQIPGGTIEIAEVGERFTAAFDFEAEQRSGGGVHVVGRAHAIPFTPSAEGGYTFQRDGETVETDRLRVAPDEPTMLIGPLAGDTINIYLPEDIEAGEHALVPRGSDAEGVPVRVPGRPEDLDGTLRIEIAEGYASGEFEFNGTIDPDAGETIEGTGFFEYVPIGAN